MAQRSILCGAPSRINKIWTPQEGNRWHAAGVTKGEKAINIKLSLSLPQSFFCEKMTAPSAMGRKHELNSILYRRDRARPCPQQTNKNKTIIGCYQIEMQTKLKAPSDEGAVVFRRKMTEGEKAINIKLSLSLLPSRLRRATFLVRGRLYSASIFI